jgi:hypothetical protein
MPLRQNSHRLGPWAFLLAVTALVASLVLAGPLGTAQARVGDAHRTGEAISGKVTNSSNVGVGSVPVTAYRLVVDTSGGRSYQAAATATTAADGTYSLALPGADSYRVGFAAPAYEPRFYPAALTVGEGTDVAVASGQTVTGRNVKLLKPATVSGKLTLADGSAYTGGGGLSLLRQTTHDPVTGLATTSWTTTATTTIASNGAFSFAAPGGTYRTRISLPGYGVGYVPGMTGLDHATGVTLTSEKTSSGITIPLPAASSVSGHVVDAQGTGIAGATVTLLYPLVDQIRDGQAITTWLEHPGASTSAADGAWSQSALHRTYRVRATGVRNGSAFTVFHPDAPTLATGTDVPVTQAVTGVDVVVGTSTTAVSNVTAPWVGGAAKAGSTLTANVGTWRPGSGVTFSYQWLKDGAVVPGATASTLALNQGSVGGKYAVRVTAASPGLTSATATSIPTGAVVGYLAGAPFENRALPVISGRPETGATLTAGTGQWSATPSGFTYQWAANGVAIAGATTQSVTVTPGVLGKTLTVTVTATSGGKTASATSPATAPITTGPVPNRTLPTITGVARVGDQLTATPGTWGSDAPSFAYRWLADGVTVAGATAATFTPTSAELGKRLSVVVTASQTGYQNGSAESAKTAPVEGLPPLAVVTAPVITGTPQVGSPLSVSSGTWTPAATSYTYQWAAGGTAIAGATASTFTPSAAQLGKTLTVTVTASRSGYPNGVTQAGPTAPVAPAPIVVNEGPTITGKARLGSTLTASPGSYDPSDATVTYQWLRSGTAVPGATGSSYPLTTADLGTKISVRATYSRAGSETVVRESPATGTVKSTPTIGVTSAVDGHKVTLTVRIRATGASGIGGQVRVVESGTELKSATVSNGRVTLTLRGVRTGPHWFAVKYSGDGTVASGRTMVKVRV